ncbi:hypothetical protein QTH90_14200 [Variovorax sp. J2P1-59]|uniref:hypothetical protein n=1 Tax=Variovorax flavidus TaxID=3053501 RepID=UPI0025750AC1|nr:hypothetical protein [Variovorax sp. J2P1-59]MDM0075550.1 hypothetical protein [Variovorax sp. J2P1-59]
MPIDRRTFMLGSGAVAGSALAPFVALATAASKGGPAPAAATAPVDRIAEGAAFELRIVGWAHGDVDAAGWIAIDPHWRGAWH